VVCRYSKQRWTMNWWLRVRCIFFTAVTEFTPTHCRLRQPGLLVRYHSQVTNWLCLPGQRQTIKITTWPTTVPFIIFLCWEYSMRLNNKQPIYKPFLILRNFPCLGVGRFRYRTVSVHTRSVHIFRYIQFWYIECQYRYNHFWYIQNIGTVHFGT